MSCVKSLRRQRKKMPRKSELSYVDVLEMVMMFECGISFSDIRSRFDRSQNAVSRYLCGFYGYDEYEFKRSVHVKMVRKKIKVDSEEYFRLLRIAKRVYPHRFYIGSSGYVHVYVPDHPYSDCRGYKQEHRLLMENKLKRYLSDNEIVHHLNHVKDDNRVSNLSLMDRIDHAREHGYENVKNLGKYAIMGYRKYAEK